MTISVLGIDGDTQCGLSAISQAASITGGTINILHPLEMVRQIRSIAQNVIVATEVEVRMITHPCLLLKTDKITKVIHILQWYMSCDFIIFMQETSRFHEEIGNTTQNMDLTVEFQTKDKDKAKKIGKIPFQVQITYRRPDQMKCLRVISKSQQFTQDRQDIEKVLLSLSAVVLNSRDHYESIIMASRFFTLLKLTLLSTLSTSNTFVCSNDVV